MLCRPHKDQTRNKVRRPGGNVTGVLFRTEGLAGKQVELALQLIPSLSKVGLLVNVASGVIIDRQDAESASKAAGIKSIAAEVRMADELQGAFEAFANEHVQAVIVLVDGMFCELLHKGG
jgi:ABC-type uncharacterized transport system substrate-binding protein